MVTPIKCTTVDTISVYEFIGKSTDKKPIASNGSKFLEMDTGKEFFFDGDEKGWFILADKYLDYIEIETAPTKTSYYVGDAFDVTGAVIKAVYTDGSSQSVSNVQAEAPEKLALDSKVAVKYVENGRTRTAEVAIEIKSNEANDKASFENICQNGSSVVLNADVSTTKQFTFTHDFELDLNGHKLTNTKASGVMFNAEGCVLTIKGNGEIDCRYRIGRAANGGSVIIENGKFNSKDVAFEAVNEGSKIVFNDGEINAVEGGIIFPDIGSTVEVNGGHISVSDNFAFAGNGSQRAEGKENVQNELIINDGVFEGNITSNGYEAIVVYVPNNDKVTINGGKFIANGGAGLVMRAGNVTINGGEIKASTGSHVPGYVGDNKTKMSASAVIYHETADYPEKAGMSLVINGGIIKGADYSVEILSNEETPNVTIKGGAFIPAIA